MPKGIYPRTEEQKKKIGEARKRFYDQHGRVVEIDQRVDRRSYQREYQKIYRKRHKHYYRDLKRKKKEAEDMSKLQEIQNVWNEIVTSAIANEYNKFEKQTDIMPLVDKLHELLIKYANEVKEENGKDEV